MISINKVNNMNNDRIIMIHSKPLFPKHDDMYDKKIERKWCTLQHLEFVPPKYKADHRTESNQVRSYRDYSK